MAATLQGVKSRFGILGRSAALDNALNTAMRVAPTDLTVLITGESGVGKEAFSKVIHGLSARKHNTFIAVNCGAIPAGTINSELFGHDKGAFTGATSDRKGYFETVDGGTIFLDEIGEMPLDTQSYLLRVLESGEFIRVGSSQVRSTDVRIVAATNVDLVDRVRKGKFREDLYYRLNTVPINIPPLRERSDDVHLLFRKFVNDFADRYRTEPIRLEEGAQRLLLNYTWPGNIRELKNVAEQLSILSDERTVDLEQVMQVLPDITKRNLPASASPQNTGETTQEREMLYNLLFSTKQEVIELKQLLYGIIRSNNLRVPDVQEAVALLDMPNATNGGRASSSASFYPENDEPGGDYIPLHNYRRPPEEDPEEEYEEVEENLSLEAMEKELIQKALKKHNGRRREAAKDLGISERTLYRKIKFYEV